jgi:hypothetical protein
MAKKKMEASTASAPAASAAPAVAAPARGTAFDPSKVKVLKELTAEFSFVLEQPAFIKALAPMKVSDRAQRGENSGKSYGPPTVLPAYDFVQGKEVEIVLGKVLASTLSESFPNDGYVGQCFQIVKHAPGKNRAGVDVKYSKYTVIQIADPTA